MKNNKFNTYNFFRKINLILIIILTSIIINSCNTKTNIKERIRFEWTNQVEPNQVQPLKMNMSVGNSINNYHLNSPETINGNNLDFFRNRPRILFEYSRSEDFTFQEILIGRSTSDGQSDGQYDVIQTGGNLDDYNLKLGGTFSSSDGMTTVRGILEVPHIRYINEKYILLSIKIIDVDSKVRIIELKDSEYIVEANLGESDIIDYISNSLQGLKIGKSDYGNSIYDIGFIDFFKIYRFSQFEIKNVLMENTEIEWRSLNGDLILRYPDENVIYLGDLSLDLQFEIDVSGSFRDFKDILTINHTIQVEESSGLLIDGTVMDYEFQNGILKIYTFTLGNHKDSVIYIGELFNSELIQEVYIEEEPVEKISVFVPENINIHGDFDNIDITRY